MVHLVKFITDWLCAAMLDIYIVSGHSGVGDEAGKSQLARPLMNQLLTSYRLARAINQCSTASRFVSSFALMP